MRHPQDNSESGPRKNQQTIQQTPPIYARELFATSEDYLPALIPRPIQDTLPDGAQEIEKPIHRLQLGRDTPLPPGH